MDCARVKTIPQFASTCWFNAILTALFYSQNMRNLILSRNLVQDTPVKRIIVEILTKYYTDNEYMKFYRTFSPEVIIKELNKENPEVFDVTNTSVGYNADKYIHKMVEYVGISNYVHFDATLNNADTNEYSLYYRPYDDEVNQTQVNEYFMRKPDIILVSTKPSLNPDNEGYPGYFKKQNIKFEEAISYNGHRYIADSMIIDNFNDRVCKKGHSICGITCSGQRYLYNGWTKKTIDRSMQGKLAVRDEPCGLMKHDWLDVSKEQFCLELDDCDITYLESKEQKIKAMVGKEMCFSFRKGARIYVYVRESIARQMYMGGNKYKYNNRMYKVRIGPRGGKYIVVQGKVVRIKGHHR